jgi:Rod binding domain-containing protein
MMLAATNYGIQPFSSQGQSAGALGSVETPTHRKLVKAAEQFEGMLISQLLGDFKGGLAAPGEESSAGSSDSLNSFAIQSLSEALARRGGLGIARMLIHQLDSGLHRGTTAESGEKIRMASQR